jgi:two-component system response regulator AtoC
MTRARRVGAAALHPRDPPEPGRMSAATVLIVDDERTLARSIKAFLIDSGYEAEVAASGEQALEQLERVRPDVIFADVRLPGMNGIELLRRIREFDAAVPVIMMTAYGTIEGAVEAVKLGAFDYLKKPVDLDELKLLTDRARESSRLKQELSYYRRRDTPELRFAEIAGQSPAMQAVLDRARQIAALDDVPPVLITGETGTGKGLLARSIHAAGPRSTKPFIEVNCTALPGTLMEAELFGHERGAFTDAKESKIGLFEAAEGGYLFLDEVGDIELSLQGKLLRAIEDRMVRRVGGIRDRKIDTRIFAATNRDLERDAQRGTFRKDLYFRLAVILLRLPPLRERGDDVLLLAEQFVRQFGAKYGKDVREISPRARALLLSYPWPGNVRELSHVIERAVLWSHGAILDPDHLSLTEPAPLEAAAAIGSDPSSAQNSGIPNTAAGIPSGGGDLPHWEKALIEQALHEAGGNQTKAAQRLGISRDTLRYRLKKFGIAG